MEQLPIFVYGTLRNGYGNYNHYLRDRTEKEVLGAIRGTMYDVGAFPAVVCGDGRVIGELMHIKPADYVNTMRNCDQLEGYYADADYGMYVRQKIDVVTVKGMVQAWIYIWNLPTYGYPVVEGGDWARYCHRVR